MSGLWWFVLLDVFLLIAIQVYFHLQKKHLIKSKQAPKGREIFYDKLGKTKQI